MRLSGVLGLVLLGAVASSVSVGYFLHKANADREYLSTRMHALEEEVGQTKADSEKLAADANAKVDTAAQEVARVQKELQSAEEERQAITKAIPLVKPDARTLKTWTEAFSIPLGISIRIPPGTAVAEYENRLQSSIARNPSQIWLSITAYDGAEEIVQNQKLTDTEAVGYLVAGNLLQGIRGRDPSSAGYAYVLHLTVDHKPAALIWVREYGSIITNQKILDTLSTLSLRS